MGYKTDPQDGETDYIVGGRRCAIRRSNVIEDWWVGVSPRNGDDAQCEGSWGDWVILAKKILEIDAKIRATR